MALVLDILVVVILLLTAITGWRMGFLRYVISSVGTIAAIIIAFLLADILSTIVYEKWIQPDISDFIEEKIKDFDVKEIVSDEIKSCGYNIEFSDQQLEAALNSQGDISEALASLAEKNGEEPEVSQQLKLDMEDFFETRFPSRIYGIFINEDINENDVGAEYTKAKAYDIVRALADNDINNGVFYIERNLVSPFVIAAVKIILMIILFIILSIAVRLIFIVAGVFDHIPVANGLNKIIGLISGIIKGLLYVLIITYGVYVLIRAGGDSLRSLNVKTINETLIFKSLFNLFYNI